jgi:regulatory protein
MRTVAELKRLLRLRAEPNEEGAIAVEVVIAKLKEQKYLNDSRYAASYSQYRQTNEKFGRRRVITDLKAKGVHSEIITQAVDAAYQEVNEEQLARQFLNRKRLKKPQNQRESARIFRMLVRAGFSQGIIFKVLKRWNVDDEVLTALSSETEDNVPD